jgi:hypothetical protein
MDDNNNNIIMNFVKYIMQHFLSDIIKIIIINLVIYNISGVAIKHYMIIYLYCLHDDFTSLWVK